VETRVSLVTLGVADLAAARDFYAALGWHGQEVQETVFVQAGALALVLWNRSKLAEDSGVKDTGRRDLLRRLRGRLRRSRRPPVGDRP